MGVAYTAYIFQKTKQKNSFWYILCEVEGKKNGASIERVWNYMRVQPVVKEYKVCKSLRKHIAVLYGG